MQTQTFAAALLSLAVAAPAFAQPAPETQAPFQVIRLGDNQMTCEALIGEINSLNGQMQQAQTDMSQRTAEMTRNAMRAARGPGVGMSAAMSLGSLAASFVPGAALAVSAAQQVASAAQMAQAQNAQNRAMEDMENLTAEMTEGMNGMGPLAQRVEHLTEISRNKGC